LILAAALQAKESPVLTETENTVTGPLVLNPDFGKNQDTVEPVKPPLDFWVPLSMTLFQNAAVWAWDYFVLQKHYAKTGPHIWKRNFEEGWQWDNNHFAVNFFGHPYQGSFYFVGARGMGYGFYPSFLYTLTGSYVWEMFCEEEYPSTNDLIVTSIGGAMYGEILFRLSQRLLSKPNPSLLDEGMGFILHPLSSLERKIFGVRTHNPGYMPMELSLKLGGGARFGHEYNYDHELYSNPDIDGWNGGFAMVGFDLIYGTPDRTIKEPFEYFTVDLTQDWGHTGGGFFRMNTLGKLANLHFNSGNNWADVGTYAHFDTYYGELVEMGALSLGVGLDFNLEFIPMWRFRMTHLPSVVVLGSSDFNYDDILAKRKENYEVTRTYQLSYGLNYKFNLEVEWLGHGIFKDKVNAYLFSTMPRSEPHYGATGFDIVGNNTAMIEAYLPWQFSIGIRLDSYIKIAAYDGKDFSPMSRIIHSIGTYIQYSL
jgi:hypothetical protein